MSSPQDAALSLRGSLAESETEARYRLAAGRAEGRRVLDAGCGLAFGTRLLAEAGARSVIGVDRAQGKLDAGRPQVPEGVELRAAELSALPFGEDEFDLIACFGPLSGGDDDGPIARELARVLAPKGLLLVSVPVTGAELLTGAFVVTRVLPERLAVAALAGEAPGAAAPASAPAPDPDRPPPEELLIAASDVALPELGRQIAFGAELSLPTLLRQIDRLRDTGQELAARLHGAERALAQRDLSARALADCEARLAVLPDLEVRLLAAERRAELAEAEAQVAVEQARDLPELQAELPRVREALERRHAEAAHAESELERCRAALEAIKASASWRVTAPVRRIAGRSGREGAGG